MIQHYGDAHGITPDPDLFYSDLTAMINGRYNHPCIVQWTAFNEGDMVSHFDPKKVWCSRIHAAAVNVGGGVEECPDAGCGGAPSSPSSLFLLSFLPLLFFFYFFSRHSLVGNLYLLMLTVCMRGVHAYAGR